jgi:hypothetical protein
VTRRTKRILGIRATVVHDQVFLDGELIEDFAGEAEDVAKVLGLGVDVSVPYGDFSGCLETLDWSALDPGTKEHKFYCAGTGLVLETAQQRGGTQVELVALTGNENALGRPAERRAAAPPSWLLNEPCRPRTPTGPP